MFFFCSTTNYKIHIKTFRMLFQAINCRVDMISCEHQTWCISIQFFRVLQIESMFFFYFCSDYFEVKSSKQSGELEWMTLVWMKPQSEYTPTSKYTTLDWVLSSIHSAVVLSFYVHCATQSFNLYIIDFSCTSFSLCFLHTAPLNNIHCFFYRFQFNFAISFCYFFLVYSITYVHLEVFRLFE